MLPGECATLRRLLIYPFLFIVGLPTSESFLTLAEDRKTFTVPFDLQAGLTLLKGQLNNKSVSLLLDTGANDSIVDVPSAGFDGLKLEALRSTGEAGAEGACAAREVQLSLEHRSWLNRRVCVMDLWVARVDSLAPMFWVSLPLCGFDYHAHTVKVGTAASWLQSRGLGPSRRAPASQEGGFSGDSWSAGEGESDSVEIQRGTANNEHGLGELERNGAGLSRVPRLW